MLKGADLPGQWASTKPGADDDGRCASFDPDQSDLVLTGEAESRDFARGPIIVGSSAEVYRSVRDAAESFRRVARPQFVRCLEAAFRGQDGVTGLAGRVVPFPAVGVRRFAIRIGWTYVQDRRRVPAYVDFIGWDRGRASASLFVLGIGAPPSQALELGLARRMDARMRADARLP